jgi:preprotein translocase subunit YajC
MNKIWFLAEADGDIGSTTIGDPPIEDAATTTTLDENGNTAPPADQEVEKKPTSPWSFAPIVVLFIVMYFLLIKGPKKKQQKHTQMVKSITKNARIQTIGGIIGTVIDIKDNEIVIKIDESNNTKMRITKGAVSTVLSDDIN